MISSQFAKAFSERPAAQRLCCPCNGMVILRNVISDFTSPGFGRRKSGRHFNAVIETTFRVIHERRAALLQMLTGNSSGPVPKKFKK
jgi:hypothetical protein